MPNSLESQAAPAARALAFAAALGVGVRLEVANGVTIALLVAVLLLPLWLTSSRQYRGMPTVFSLGLLAAVAGLLLTLLDDHRATNVTMLASETLMMVTMLGILGVLLWARTQIGIMPMALAFGLGMLASVVVTGGNPTNLWKYSLGVPIAIIVLAIAGWKSDRRRELVALAALGLVSFSADSRSFASIVVLSGLICLWQLWPRRFATTKGGALRTIVTLTLLGYALYELMQALLLEGALGAAAQQRSQAQLDSSGSLVAGGRPEFGATIALLVARPLGYGSGVVPSSSDVWIAKSGMSDLNYNPNNGYVEVFMFGRQFEVHSVLGDLWLRFSPVGGALALVIVIYSVYFLARHISHRQASALAALLAFLTVWNTAFSPFATSYRSMALAMAMLAVAKAPATLLAVAGDRGAIVPNRAREIDEKERLVDA